MVLLAVLVPTGGGCRVQLQLGRTRFVVSKLINSGSKFRPKKYQYSGDKERGRHCVGLS